MPPRRQRRPDHARPIRHDRPASPFLTPLTLAPLSERRPRRLRRVRAWLAGVGAGGLLTLSLPIMIGAIPPSVIPPEPLGGGVAGVVSQPNVAARSTVDAAAIHSVARYTDHADGPTSPQPATAPPVESLTGYQWPIARARVSLPFKAIPGGEWINHGRRWHDGLDMASFCGAPVGAAHAGIVLAAGRHFDDQIGWIGDLGPYYRRLDQRHAWHNLPIVVVIDDLNGYRSIYAHFRDVTVKAGQRVRAGQLIGHEGATGHASGCHVHYGLFSPFETARFEVRSDIRRHLLTPRFEIARVDPALVMPGGDVAVQTRQIAMAIAADEQRQREARRRTGI